MLNLDHNILVTTKNSEDLQVVNYQLRQKYDSHHDWGVSGYNESRFITLLLYLTDGEAAAGGETAFPKAREGAGFKVRPTKGSAILFYNLLEDGNGDDLALHAALPVTILRISSSFVSHRLQTSFLSFLSLFLFPSSHLDINVRCTRARNGLQTFGFGIQSENN